MASHNISNAKGFTIIELLIVLAIATLVSGIGLIYGYDTFSRSSVRSEEDTLGRLLQTTRIRAMSNVNEQPHGLHIGDTTYTLFRGTSYDETNLTNENFPRAGGVEISGPNDIVFSQLSGN